MSKPVLLDLFCGTGGAGMGYSRAGFDVVGVDLHPQKNYPFRFIQADAMTFPLEGYDAIHASPPCQAYTMAGQQWRASGKEYPDLVVATRERLIAAGVPYVIENVPGAPLLNPTILNGAFFGMLIRRVRHFETSFAMPFILLPKDAHSKVRMGRPPRDGEAITPVGHFSGIAEVKRRMGIDWMNQKELAQAIPPTYTEFIGRILIASMAVAA